MGTELLAGLNCAPRTSGQGHARRIH